MLQYAKEQNLDTKITLLYSNRDQALTAFLKELHDLATQHPMLQGKDVGMQFKLVLTMTEDPSWKGEKRRIDAQFIKEYTEGLQNPLYYVAGPPAMADAIVDTLKELGIESSRIKSENFTGY